MMISTKGRYGLRAMVDLGVYSEKEPVSISSIAERQQISDSYLEQLFGKLKKAGLVLSIRGAQGGYQLARKPEEISVGDVVFERWFDGSIEKVTCIGIGEDRVVNGTNVLGVPYTDRYGEDNINSYLREKSYRVVKKNGNS
jgi:Rrf2 family protein